MRKTWLRVLFICMACIICMQGLCLAEWFVDFYHPDQFNYWQVDRESIYAREYEGRKYLDLKVISEERRSSGPGSWFKMPTGKYHLLYDIENGKGICLESEKPDGFSSKKTSAPVSQIKNGHTLDNVDLKLLQWVEQNRPDIINEIRTHNESLEPEDNTDQSLTISESGAVEFVSRRGSLPSLAGQKYCVFIKPEKCNAWPGKYAYGFISDYVHGETGDIRCSMEYTFDYDAQNNVFQFYSLNNEDPSVSQYNMRLQVIDKNTIHVTLLMGRLTQPPIFESFRWSITYEGYNRLADITKLLRTNPQSIAIPANYRELAAKDVLVFHYKPYSDDPDVNGCQWVARYFDFKDKRTKDCVLQDLMTRDPELKVEAAMCFLSVNGNVGELAEDYEIEVYSDPNGL